MSLGDNIMTNDYVLYFFEIQEQKIPGVFRIRENTRNIVKWSVIGIVIAAVVAGFFFCFGGRGMGQIEAENAFGPYSFEYPELSLIIAITASLLIALVFVWMGIAIYLRKRAFAKACEIARPLIEKDKAKGDMGISWNRERSMRQLITVDDKKESEPLADEAEAV